MNYLSLAVIGSSIAAGWNYISGFLNRLRSLVIVNVTIENEANNAFLYLMWKEFKKSKLGDKRFDGFIRYVNPMKKTIRVGVEKISSQTTIFWRGWKPIIMTIKTNSQYDAAPYEQRSFISFIRWHYNIDELLIEALDKYNSFHSDIDVSKKRNRFKIIKIMGKEKDLNYTSSMAGQAVPPEETNKLMNENITCSRILKYNLSDLEMLVPNNPFQGYFFEPEIEGYIQEVEYWLKSQNYFEEINVPFKRGWTLHSVAGCGKTSLVRAIGQKFDLPIVLLDLATMNNHDLERSWKEALSHAPCIILLEDFDNIYDGRKNIASEKGVTFDCLLNCIGGVEDTNGIFTIVTTNNIKKLDYALIRPGRCGDRIIELKIMSTEQKLKMARHILKDCPQYIKNTLKGSEHDTPAKFQQKCSDIALKNHWQKLVSK